MPINNVKVNFLFPHLSLLRNLSSIWALPYIKTFIRLPETILITFSLRSKMTFKDGRILKSLSKEESPLLRWICYLDLIFVSLCYTFSPSRYFKEINSIISKFIWNDKCPRIKLTTLQHPNSAGGLAVPILNYIIGRSSLRPFIIGLILNLQFHGGWLKLTRLNQIDFKIFYLLAQEKKGIIIIWSSCGYTLLKSGKRLNVG